MGDEHSIRDASRCPSSSGALVAISRSTALPLRDEGCTGMLLEELFREVHDGERVGDFSKDESGWPEVTLGKVRAGCRDPNDGRISPEGAVPPNDGWMHCSEFSDAALRSMDARRSGKEAPRYLLHGHDAMPRDPRQDVDVPVREFNPPSTSHRQHSMVRSRRVPEARRAFRFVAWCRFSWHGALPVVLNAAGTVSMQRRAPQFLHPRTTCHTHAIPLSHVRILTRCTFPLNTLLAWNFSPLLFFSCVGEVREVTDNRSRTALELLLPAGPCSSLLTTAPAHRVVANPSGTEVSRCDGGVCEAGLSKPGRWAGAGNPRSGV